MAEPRPNRHGDAEQLTFDRPSTPDLLAEPLKATHDDLYPD